MQDSADPVRLRASTFEAFYASAWDAVYRPVAIVLGDPGLAAEAVDEAMTRAFERWSSVSRMENPEGWVYRVAVNWADGEVIIRNRLRPVVRALDRLCRSFVELKP